MVRCGAWGVGLKFLRQKQLSQPDSYFFQVNTPVMRLSGRGIVTALFSTKFSMGPGSDYVQGRQLAD